jgi:hypothetical protein
MSYRSYLDYLAKTIEWHIRYSSDVQTLDTEDFGWYNSRYTSDIFRMAHVERYSDDKIEVLHVTTFPHHWSPEPIFGFDVICTDGKVVGVYMDLSPGITEYPFDEGMIFEERKPLPEWATVFSDRFILLKPKDDIEFGRFVSWTLHTYKWYLAQLHKKIVGNPEEIIPIQNNYCKVQSSNPRTYSVLKSKLGEERAKYFMTNILFPIL